MEGADGLRIGVLMVGSLYWDEDREYRNEWRDDHLEMSTAQHVKVPIRYGRRSRSRECTFTMVFSTRLIEEGTLGQGIVVPCKSTDLVREAVYLWKAETNNRRNPRRAISAEWGCVAIVENPGNQMPNRDRNEWIERVSRERCYGHLNSATDEKVAVDGRGFLQIPWPEPVEGGTIALNVLLATARESCLLPRPNACLP